MYRKCHQILNLILKVLIPSLLVQIVGINWFNDHYLILCDKGQGIWQTWLAINRIGVKWRVQTVRAYIQSEHTHRVIRVKGYFVPLPSPSTTPQQQHSDYLSATCYRGPYGTIKVLLHGTWNLLSWLAWRI